MDNFDVEQMLGNYRLIRQLAAGNFADVYLCEHVHLGSQAAIKILCTHLMEKDRKSFLREARTIARLDHPNIIKILEYAFEGEIPFLVMEYASHGTLRQRHIQGSRVLLDTVLTYVKQVAVALQYTHEQKLVHCNVKPENMLVGQDERVLLSDFRIAVVAHSTASQSMQEVEGAVTYIAPEQLQGRPRPASDQYALGAVVYEWLCGIPPFSGTDYLEVAIQHISSPPLPLRQRGIEISPAVEAVVMKALAKEPSQRFASLQGFAHAFEQACGGLMSPVILNTSPLIGEEAKERSAEPIPQRANLSRRSLILGIVGTSVVVGGGVAWLAHNFPGSRSPAMNSTPPGIVATATLPAGPIGTTFYIYQGHDDFVNGVTWSPDGRRMASCSRDNTVQVWDAFTGGNVLIYRQHHSFVNRVAWSPDGNYIASGSSDNTVRIWDAGTGGKNFTYTYDKLSAPVAALAWAPLSVNNQVLLAENIMFSVSRTGMTTNVAYDDTHFRNLSAQYGEAWLPDGKRIVTGTNHAEIQFWDATTGLPGNPSTFSIDSVKYFGILICLSDGKLLAATNATYQIKIWDLNTGKAVVTYQSTQEVPISRPAWSPDGKYMACSGIGVFPPVFLWDVTNGNTIYTYPNHSSNPNLSGISQVAWSPNGQYIASVSDDATVRIWKGR